MNCSEGKSRLQPIVTIFLAIQAGRFLAELWGTDLLVAEEMSGFMVNIILPSSNRTAIAEIQASLNSTYNLYMVAGPATSFVPSFNNEDSKTEDRSEEDCLDSSDSDLDCDPAPLFITRLSAQVYLELSDFERLGHLVLQLLGISKSTGSRVA